MVVLGIETSCDDTAISLIEDGKDIYSKKISSESILKRYGGIIPEIAARKHEQAVVDILIDLKDKFDLTKIDYIAYTNEPGLAVSLHVGKIFANTLGLILNKPTIAVNHIHGHIFSPFINHHEDISYPFLSLIASGGTTSLFLVNSVDDIQILNETGDDAIGESFDKVGRALGLDYPGGISIDKIYDETKVNKSLLPFPKPNQQFSFSGIKTKILNLINQSNMKNQQVDVIELASTFQYWSINVLIDKIKYYQNEYDTKLITIGGGVSSNSLFRKEISKLNSKNYIPEQQYSCDNGTMIAFLGFLKKLR